MTALQQVPISKLHFCLLHLPQLLLVPVLVPKWDNISLQEAYSIDNEYKNILVADFHKYGYPVDQVNKNCLDDSSLIL